MQNTRNTGNFEFDSKQETNFWRDLVKARAYLQVEVKLPPINLWWTTFGHILVRRILHMASLHIPAHVFNHTPLMIMIEYARKLPRPRNIEFFMIISLPPTCYSREQGKKAGSHHLWSDDLVNVHHANMRTGSHKEVAKKLSRRPPTSTHYKYPPFTHGRGTFYPISNNPLFFSSTFNSWVPKTAGQKGELKVGEKKQGKPSYKEEDLPEEMFMLGLHHHRYT